MAGRRAASEAASGRRHRIQVRPAVIHAQLVDRRSLTVRAETPYRIDLEGESLRGTTDPAGVLFHAGVPIGWFAIEVQGERSFVDSFIGSRADPPSRVWLDGGAEDAVNADDAAPPEPDEGP